MDHRHSTISHAAYEFARGTFLKTCLVTTTWLLAQAASAAIVVDPLSSGATDVSIGNSAPYPPVTNPVPDPYNLPAGGDGLLVVGRNSAGSFEVNAGSDAAVGQIWIANNVGSTGKITVRNPGSSLTSMYDIRVGQNGVGELEIIDSGAVLAEQVYVHSDVVGSPSRLTVSGAGTKLTATYGLFLGYGRHAVVTTSDAHLSKPTEPKSDCMKLPLIRSPRQR